MKRRLDWDEWMKYPFHETHWLNQPLNIHRVRQVKSHFDADKVFKYKYWMTGTWSPTSLRTMKTIICEAHAKDKSFPANPTELDLLPKLDLFRASLVNQLMVDLAQDRKAHIKAYNVLSTKGDNVHFHGNISSTKVIRHKTVRRHWDWGIFKHFAKYNPKYGEWVKGDPDWSSFKYSYMKHHPIKLNTQLFHPGWEDCKQKNCEVCRLATTIDFSSQEEVEM